MLKVFILGLVLWSSVHANEAIIEDVKVLKQGSRFTFTVRILHQDSGWEHYVDRYEIIDKKGRILATRVLVHPHELEQPFTRSLSNVKIKDETHVYVRAHDSVDGYSQPYEITLP